MDIAIREATAGDYEALCIIMHEVDRMHRDALPQRFRTPDGPARERDYVMNAIRSPDVGLFVAEKAGQLVGFLHAIVRHTSDIPILVPRRYVVIDNLAVTEEHRRSGIGRALMEKAEAWARAKGATSIELNVYAFNQTAKRFYQELGYKIVSHRMTKSLQDSGFGTE